MTVEELIKKLAEIVELEYVIETQINDEHTEAVHQVIHNISENLAMYFSTGNPRFDRDKFMAACGLD